MYTGINLTVEAGQTVALVGPSGCGKSTVVSLVERFYDPSAGGVFLDGTDIRELRVSWLRGQVGMVGQEPTLFTGSIFENISQGKAGSDGGNAGGGGRRAPANAYDTITGFPEGFATRVGEKGIQLSGGQKQRIAIARAIIRDPQVLILDEAEALDSTSERVVQAALDGLLAAKQRTAIVIAHRLSIKNADKIVVLSDGAVVEEGTHDVLMDKKGLCDSC